MTDVSGESPVDGSSARPSDVLVSVRSALAVMSLLALTVLDAGDRAPLRARDRVGARRRRARGARVSGGRVRRAVGCRAVFVVVLLVIVGLSAIGFVELPDRQRRDSATDRLQQAAPKRRGRELEEELRSARGRCTFGGACRTSSNDIPNRLAGGRRTKALESAATAGSRSWPDSSSRSSSWCTDRGSSARAWTRSAIPTTRRLSSTCCVRGTRRGLDYAWIKLLEALVGGVLAYVIARRGGRARPGRARRVGRLVDAAARRRRVRRRAADRVVRGRVVADACGRRSGSRSW